MSTARDLDAVVVGAGPNGLAAAITMARAGRSVRVFETASAVGGGLRTEERTLPGVRHDVCATVLPLTLASAFFRSIDLARHGVEFVQPEAPLAHPLDDGRVGLIQRSVADTAARLDASGAPASRDGAAWQRLFGPLVGDAGRLAGELLGPVVHLPRHPLALARFGLPALRSARGLAESHFQDDPAQALFSGLAAHSMLDLRRPLTASFALVLGLYAHAVGWPMIRGGSAVLAEALAAELRALGGEIVLDHSVTDVADLPAARSLILDLTPRQVLAIAGDRLPGRTRRAFERYRYGPGVFKVDWALDGPIPWRDPDVARAATVHLGGTMAEIVEAESQVACGGHPDRPFTLLVQYAPWDTSRAPTGISTAWAYCHVPAGSPLDMTARIERQIERFAPGFGDRILARATLSPAQMEAHDPNNVGGDINGGVSDIRQLLARPMIARDPYRIGEGLYLCSASTPPGGGVHGMGGWRAARSALRHEVQPG